MKAIQLPRYGPPDVFKEIDSPTPSAAAGEIVVRTVASGINFADLMQRLGLYGNAPKPPYVPGFEVAGDVIAVGEGVGHLRIGDRVVLMTQAGGYAEELAVAVDRVLPIPASIDYVEAAALPVNYLTAWMCLFTMGNLRPDETVLIHGGAGGVGTAAVQLARRHGATVIATAGSRPKIDYLQQAGVGLAVNYRDDDWDRQIRDRFGKRSVDLVLDPVGGEPMQRSYALLAPLGRLVAYGLSQAVAGSRRNLWHAWRALRRTPRFNPIDMTQRNTGVFGFHLGLLRGKEARVMEALQQILELVSSGEITPVIAETFPLTARGVADAHQYLHARKNIGKVLLVA